MRVQGQSAIGGKPDASSNYVIAEAQALFVFNPALIRAQEI